MNLKQEFDLIDLRCLEEKRILLEKFIIEIGDLVDDQTGKTVKQLAIESCSKNTCRLNLIRVLRKIYGFDLMFAKDFVFENYNKIINYYKDNNINTEKYLMAIDTGSVDTEENWKAAFYDEDRPFGRYTSSLEEWNKNLVEVEYKNGKWVKK